MNYRAFGNTDLKVSEIGFGCNKLGNSIFSKTNLGDNIKLLNAAFDHGINFYDVAPTYSYGEGESILGDAFKKKRQDIIISTKGGRLPTSLAKYGKTLKYAKSFIGPLISPFKTKLKKISTARFDFSSSHLNASIELSLKRLKTDYIDIYFLHNPSLEVIQQGAVFEALENLKQQGKIRYYGVSIDTLDEALAALKHPIDGLQITFNIIQEKMTSSLLIKLDDHNNVGIAVKTPLLRGLLTENAQLRREYFSDKIADRIQNKLDDLSPIFESRKINHGALQYIFNHPKISSAFCGTTSLPHLKQNIEFRKSLPFTSDEWNHILAIRGRYEL